MTSRISEVTRMTVMAVISSIPKSRIAQRLYVKRRWPTWRYGTTLKKITQPSNATRQHLAPPAPGFDSHQKKFGRELSQQRTISKTSSDREPSQKNATILRSGEELTAIRGQPRIREPRIISIAYRPRKVSTTIPSRFILSAVRTQKNLREGASHRVLTASFNESLHGFVQLLRTRLRSRCPEMSALPQVDWRDQSLDPCDHKCLQEQKAQHGRPGQQRSRESIIRRLRSSTSPLQD